MDDPVQRIVQEWNKHRRIKLVDTRTSNHDRQQDAKSDANECDNHDQQHFIKLISLSAGVFVLGALNQVVLNLCTLAINVYILRLSRQVTSFWLVTFALTSCLNLLPAPFPQCSVTIQLVILASELTK